jgi:NAD(P)H dehydrogenase (quinone)
MSIVITGATGKLGGQTVECLLRRGVPPEDIVAAGRDPERLAALAARGVRTVRFDVEDPGSVTAAFAEASKVLLVSVPGNPQRAHQQRQAIEAAAAADVELLVYASFVLAGKHEDHADHDTTERALQASDLPGVVLRNGVYFSYFARQIPDWCSQGAMVGAAGAGRISAASHADLADAAASVLTAPGHEGAVYELGIDDAFTLSELAAEVSRQTAQEIRYVELPPEQFEQHLVDAGMAEGMAQRRANVDRAMSAGLYEIRSGALRGLTGRPLTTLGEAVSHALGRT